MASPKSTLPNSREEQDSAYNPGALHNDESRFGSAGKSASSEDGSNEQVRQAEEAGDATQGDRPDFVSRVTGEKRPRESRWSKVFIFAQRRGGVLGLLGALGVGGGIMVGYFGPASMLISMMENLSITNDSSSTVLERRFLNAFSFSVKGDPVCANNSKLSLRCQMGKISYNALDKLSGQGLVAYFEDGSDYDGQKKSGYPPRNPTGYTADLGDGRGPQKIPAADLLRALNSSPELAARVLGKGGAFNLKFKAWTGKYITQKLFDPFRIPRDGGIADGKNGELDGQDRRTSLFEKLRARIPAADAIGNVADGVKAKVDRHLGKAKAGGIAYTVAVAGCIGIKAPSFIASGVAAVQLAQTLPMVTDTILSPGSKAKAAGFGSGFTGEDMAAAGTILTEKTPRKSDGKLTGPLDSKYLLAAIGVNKNKVPISEEYTPGYSVLSNPAVRLASQADKALEPACNGIMSPAAMYTALAVNSAVTVAASSTIVLGIVKVVAEFVLTEVAVEVTKHVAGDAAKAAVIDLAKNDAIPKAEGEELGDVLGIAGPALFSAGGMGRNLNTLTQAQLPEFSAIQQESEEFYRQMDIATLSPFDVSSRYTFLGSILNDARMAVLGSGNYGNVASMLSSLAQLPILAALPTASADGEFSETYCDYAEEFFLSTGDPTTTPAVNMSGMPCTGMTESQAKMSTDEALSLIESEGWLDSTKPVYDSDTIEDLNDRGYFKEDTPLSNHIESCGHPETGDYIFNTAGCTVNTTTADPEEDCVGTGGGNLCTGELEEWEGEVPEGVNNPRALEAMAVLLADYQDHQILNGEDEEDVTSGNSPGTFASPVSPGTRISSSMGPRVPPCPDCTNYHQGTDFTGSDGAVFALADGVVTRDGSDANNRNNIVQIRHADGLLSSYWHMYDSDILVKTGDTVTAGQRLGRMGSHGQSTGVHLHFELDISKLSDADKERYKQLYKISDGGTHKGSRVDPEDFLAKNGVEGF